MGLFAVTALRVPSGMERAIQRLRAPALQLHPGTWLVAYPGTPHELSDKLGISTGEVGPGLVCAVAGHAGRASSDVWEWLAANGAAKPRA